MASSSGAEVTQSLTISGLAAAGEVGVSPTGAAPPTPADRPPAVVAPCGAAETCMEPQAPHSGQRPSHLGEEYPHSEQVWMLRAFFAMP